MCSSDLPGIQPRAHMALYFTWRMTIHRSAIQIVPLPFSMLLVQRIFATWLPRRDGIGYEVEAMRSIRTELAVPSWTSTPPFVLVTSTRSLSLSKKMKELAGVPLVGFGHEPTKSTTMDSAVSPPCSKALTIPAYRPGGSLLVRH